MPYNLEEYDCYSVLKPPMLFYVTILYLLKYPILIILPWVPRMGEATYLNGIVHQHFHWSLLIFSCLPAGFVLFAAMLRKPKSGPFPRHLWAKARSILLFALAADFVILAGLIMIGFHKLSIYVLVIGYLDVLLFAYVWRSRRLRDIFSQFPAPPKQT